jgi:hypothetical protein
LGENICVLKADGRTPTSTVSDAGCTKLCPFTVHHHAASGVSKPVLNTLPAFFGVLFTDAVNYTGYTQKNGAVSKVNGGT